MNANSLNMALDNMKRSGKSVKTFKRKGENIYIIMQSNINNCYNSSNNAVNECGGSS